LFVASGTPFGGSGTGVGDFQGHHLLLVLHTTKWKNKSVQIMRMIILDITITIMSHVGMDPSPESLGGMVGTD